MPLIYGQQIKEHPAEFTGDIEQYRKWFDTHGYDFSISWENAEWRVYALNRETLLLYRGRSSQELTIALHSAYMEIRAQKF
jgi:hypothetical protein